MGEAFGISTVSIGKILSGFPVGQRVISSNLYGTSGTYF
jgi:hypothetical protein